jgi:hypothetical protein
MTMAAATTTVTKLNMSKRNIMLVTIVSIVLTLSCLFYVTHTREFNYYTNRFGSSSSFISDYNALNQDARPSYKKDKSQLTCLSNTAALPHGNVTTKEEWHSCLDAGKEPQYYLSIVIVTRMDDYAG